MGEYFWKSKNVKCCGVDDMVLLPKIEIPVICENLHKRLMDDMIYTYIGNVLIAVNPFKSLPYFTDKQIDQYQNSTSYENPPHVYCLGDSAYRNMIGEGESQCVIISGESGAGKTVSAKYVMNYIIKVSGDELNVQRVKDIILQSNPLLEAFGNAKTLRNDNSSRFGKYVEILFKAGGTPEGGRITNFLLEKSRVCHQNEGERNFHFFYQMLAGLDDKRKRELNLTTPEDFPYLSESRCYTVSGIDDAKDFNEVMQSMEIVGLTKDVQQSIITLVSGILHLSCVTFGEEKNQATVKNSNSVNLASKCFQIDPNGLIKVLVSRDMESKWGNTSELIVMEHNKEQALFALDAISKAIYSRIFSYLVDAINHEIDINDSQKSIGILDIYGFEIFSKNGFEQFCINYVNEKLQQIFIELTLKKEQEEYMAEKIKWSPISFFNNKVVCDLIEGKAPTGIISIMDDVCATMHAKGEGADQKLIDDLRKTVSGNEYFNISGAGFIISHYAGKVTYDIDNFCEKNRDVLFNDPIDLMKTSKCKFLASLFPEITTGEKKTRPTTAGTKIRTQANILVEKLMRCQPHYIRCIKPNETKKPYEFDDKRVKHQVEYLGLKENIRIKRAGFAYYRPFENFLSRFSILTPESYPFWRGDKKEGIAHIINSVGIERSEWELGVSKVFIKTPESLFLLEEIRDRKFDGFARIIQKQWRLANNKSAYDSEKQFAAQIVVNKKQRYYASINRRFAGNYFNLDDQPILLTFIEKKENVVFSSVVTKYDRKFRPTMRDLLVTQKNIYLIGREKIKKGPQKGRIVDVKKRKIPYDQLEKLQLSKFQDDFLAIDVKQDYSTLIETPLKTELIYFISKFYEKFARGKLNILFSDKLEIAVKKEGFKLSGRLTVNFKEDPKLPNNFRILKSSMSKLLVTIKPGEAASSMPITSAVSSSYKSQAKRMPSSDASSNRNAKAASSNLKKTPSKTPPSIPKKKAPPKPPVKNECKALWDYEGNAEGELCFQAGDIIQLITEDGSGWWKGKFNGQIGLFPYNYVEKI